ncbi:MAG: hypothetical protein FD125_1253 [bacterium]|nr:MAG: hypothetical protein FD125_1253 [bacterium]
MRKLSLALSAAALSAAAAPALASDLTVSIEIPRIAGASYHRPYVAVWIERPDNTAVRTLAVWYQQTANQEGDGKDWLKDMRTWWRRAGRAMTLPVDGVPGTRLSNLPAGDYVMVVEAARELGGREVVRIPFRWGAANTARATGSTELGAVSVAVTR